MPTSSQTQLAAAALGLLFGRSLEGATVGVWGLVDDHSSTSARNGESGELIAALVKAGAFVQVYDPAVDRLDGAYAAPDGYDVARDAHALVVFADASELRETDFMKVYEIMAVPRLIDASGALDPDEMRALGFDYLSAVPEVPTFSQYDGIDNVRRLGDGSHQEWDFDSESLSLKPKARGLKAKRAFDLMVGIPLALAALPLIATFAIGIAISFRCWPFFTQWRTGKDGTRFKFLKIRSLPPQTPAYANKFDLDQESLPWLAGFLRKQHLDELPQLLLVPIGKMSLVGPRPKMPDDHEPIDETFGALRTTVPQGCTGLWQIGEHAHLRVCDSADYDFAYLRYGSVKFDLWVLWRTALLLIGKNTPVSLKDDSSIPQWVRGNGFLNSVELLPNSALVDEESAVTAMAA